MRLANVRVWLNRAESALPKDRTAFPNPETHRLHFWQSDQQAIRKLPPDLVGMNPGRDDFGCACVIKCVHKLDGVAFMLKAAKESWRGCPSLSLQPGSRLEPIGFRQQAGNENLVNMLFSDRFIDRPPGSSDKLRQLWIVCRFRAIFVRRDQPALKINLIGKQRAVTQPTATPTTEFAAQRGDFALELPAIVPRALNARAIIYVEAAK